jgi:hypothetical protein
MSLSRFVKVITVVLLMWNANVLATTHALIMSIGNYQAGVTQLPGVKYDMESAKLVAHSLGVRDENITQLHDGELTLEGMRKAFDTFAKQIRANDEVFIYYSGHGGREYVKDPEDRCAESLITVDGRSFIDAELSARLRELSERSRRMIVFIDACHSGGVTTRGVHSKSKNARFVPKYWSKGKADACSKPTNIITQNLEQKTRSVGSGAQNYVYISAARNDEISLDEPGKGGLATQEWVKCISGAASDTDGSGALSADEIRTCAQTRIDKDLEGEDDVKAHHITIIGNPNSVLAVRGVEAETGAATSKKVSPFATLKDIYSSRDDRRVVTITAEKTALRIGKDKVQFNLSSTHAGYVYLLMVGSDGKTFDLLFPNALDTGHYLEPGEILKLPAPNWEIVAQGPKGSDHLLVIVSDSPRDFSKLGAKPAGPFSVVDVDLTTARDIQVVTAASTSAKSAECRTKMTAENSNSMVNLKCSDAYGAAILKLEEIAD